jgi:hypothetical protein
VTLNTIKQIKKTYILLNVYGIWLFLDFKFSLLQIVRLSQFVNHFDLLVHLILMQSVIHMCIYPNRGDMIMHWGDMKGLLPLAICFCPFSSTLKSLISSIMRKLCDVTVWNKEVKWSEIWMSPTFSVGVTCLPGFPLPSYTIEII